MSKKTFFSKSQFSRLFKQKKLWYALGKTTSSTYQSSHLIFRLTWAESKLTATQWPPLVRYYSDSVWSRTILKLLKLKCWTNANEPKMACFQQHQPLPNVGSTIACYLGTTISRLAWNVPIVWKRFQESCQIMQTIQLFPSEIG